MKATAKWLTPFVHRQVCARILHDHKRRGDVGLLAVGMGLALKRGLLDPSRGIVVHFFVREKLPISNRHPWRIPKQVQARFLSAPNKRWMVKRLHTDIIAVGDGQLTGVEVSGQGYFTAGYVMRYQAGGQTAWALLSVGHGCAAGSKAVFVPTLNTSCQIIAATGINDPNDVCLIGITAAQLGALSTQTFDQTTPPLPYLDLADALSNFQEVAGEIDDNFVNPAPIPIQVISCTGTTTPGLIPGAPNLQDLMLATAPTDGNAFAEGTSGSPWIGTRRSAIAMQTAVTAYSQGYGQLLDGLIKWAIVKLNDPAATLVGWI